MESLYGLNLDDELTVDYQVHSQGRWEEFAAIAQGHGPFLFDLKALSP